MYEKYFGLCRRPFSSVAQIKEYFPAAAIESARQNLIRCVQRGEGAGLAIGPSGTGKTLLCQLVADHFQGQFRVAMLGRSSITTRRALLQAGLYELRQPYRGMDEGELRLALVEYLTANEECPAGMLLVVDDAHALPLRVLDEIRTLTNVAVGGQPRVRLVLVGNGPLEERLASPKLDSFSQRIVARCYLESFNRSETQQYIYAQLRNAGGTAEQVLSTEACEAVHRATDGVPRLVNQLCDHTLILAFTGKRRPVDAACVEEAWADLQQLPTPWNGESKTEKTGVALVEFGGLDDDDARPAEAGPKGRSTVPMLRVAGAEEEPAAPAASTEPLEQLRRIEAAISELDGDFQPAGSIGPEVELVFADPGNPFSERFEQEEPVVERYTMPAAAPEKADTPAPASRRVRIEAPQPAAAVTSSEPQPGEARCLPLRGDEPEELPGDNDMIVVDEGYDDVPPPPARQVTPVRHLEYRRLFAKLRHG